MSEVKNLSSSRNDGNTVLAVVLMYIGLWLVGSVITSGFIIIVKSYDTALKNDDWVIMGMSIGWTMYCFCNGYLKYMYVKNYR
jgi:hypothetical protein